MFGCHLFYLPKCHLSNMALIWVSSFCGGHQSGDGACEKIGNIFFFVGNPHFWKRYVDNVCCSILECDVNVLLVHLNLIEPSVQFTCEIEENRYLPYLDILLKHNLDGTISTTVYRKPTRTERYLDLSSHHPPTHKAAVVKSRFD